MRFKILKPCLIFILFSINISILSQEIGERFDTDNRDIDSLTNNSVLQIINDERAEVSLSNDQSIKYLLKIFNAQYWKNPDDPLRLALGRLVYEASRPPFDSVSVILETYPYDSLNINLDLLNIQEPLNDSKVLADSLLIDQDRNIINTSDTLLAVSVYIPEMQADTLVGEKPGKNKLPNPDFPFRYLKYPYQGDSIQLAVNSLLKYLEIRDSSVISFTGVDSKIFPFWINSQSGKMLRFWLKNEYSDSVTIWIGSPSRNTLGLYLEQGVNFSRPVKRDDYSAAKIDIEQPDNSKLQEVQKIVLKNQYWKFRTEANFSLNQTSLTNWVKGGESSIAIATDITAYADYINNTANISSNNFIRLKYGEIAIHEFENNKWNIKKNLDLIETNSKLNHKAFGKFDFSSIMLFKTQIARGYKYPNDSVAVSKFMNPAILTLGFGLDYKPNKNTSLNFSPFSYKGTFVIDTLNIDQTKYGIAKDKKSKNEPGVSFMISNEYKPFKNITITNRLQLFTNYINNPQNIDIDWEMIVIANLNWFTDVRFNTHLIFDDDTKTVEMDGGKPVLRSDGTEKKTARPQFKEMIGFSFVFRF